MSVFTALNQAFILCTTGFETDVLDEYVKNFHVPEKKVPDFVAALIMMHTNCTDAQLCVYFNGIFNKTVATSTLVDRAQKMLEFIFQQPVLTRVNERFTYADPLMANVTCFADGTSVNVRLPDVESGFKGKCANFQVLTMLNGEPMAYSGPYTGRLTDARNFCQDSADAERTKFCEDCLVTELAFDHHLLECIGMDGIYKANLHAFVPYEAVPSDTTDVTSRKRRMWNYLFTLRRARIERKFGQLDRHKFFHYCQRTVATVALMFRLMWNGEIIKARRSPSHAYRDELVASSTIARDLGPKCACNWDGMWPVTHSMRTVITNYRDALSAAYLANHGWRVRIARPQGHESEKKKRDRDDNAPLVVTQGLAEFVHDF